MRAALDGVDVVHVREDALVVRCIVGHGHLDGDALFLSDDVDHVVDQRLFRFVDVAHKLLQTIVRIEDLGFVCPVRLHLTLVGQRQADTGIQEGQFAESVGQDVVFVFRHGEDRRIRLELDGCPGAITVTHYPNIGQRLAAGELLHVDCPVAMHLSLQMGRQCIDT